MATVNAYMTFNGNCEAAFDFYKSVFGGEYQFIGRFKDVPAGNGPALPESAGDKIMHVSLPISAETSLMGSDAHPMMGAVTIGQNVSMSVSVGSNEEADKIFNGLAAGGQVTMPIGTTFWSPYFGMLKDQFGILWMISNDHPKEG